MSYITLALIVMVVLCCARVLCNRSRKRKITANEQMGNGGQQNATQAHLVNNPAYLVGNNFNDRLVNNPAYNNQLTSNPADNYNGDIDPYY